MNKHDLAAYSDENILVTAVNHDFEASCYGKLKHETRELADIAAGNLKRHGYKKAGYKIEAYACRFGDHWHVGSQSTKKKRRLRKQRLARTNLAKQRPTLHEVDKCQKQ